LVYAGLMFHREIKAPALLARTGDFSYSLYLIHWPLLLLCLSLTQVWLGSSLVKSLLVGAGSSILVLLAAALFARFFEDQPRFKPYINAALRWLSGPSLTWRRPQ
jgi:peptidoglycan/LPS O-acetylase OafA/YrhL